MVDVLSGGRLVAGFPVGTSMDSAFAYGQNPATLREKYREGVELILKAWTADEPFPFNGKYTKLRYVNPWPRPIQKPHPPVWVPGGGSSIETWEWCATHDFMYASLSYFGYLRAMKSIKSFWETIDRLGLEPNPYRAGFLQFVAVADDDAHAEKLYSEAAQLLLQPLPALPAGLPRGAGVHLDRLDPGRAGELDVGGDGRAGQDPGLERLRRARLHRGRQPRHDRRSVESNT